MRRPRRPGSGLCGLFGTERTRVALTSDGGGLTHHGGKPIAAHPMTKRFGSFLLSVAMAATVTLGGCGKSPEPVAKAPVAPAVVANVPDIDVTEHVTTALHQKGLGKGLDLKVGTLNGEVRLDGMLDNQAQVDEAVRIARASDGVHTVHNHLTVRK